MVWLNSHCIFLKYFDDVKYHLLKIKSAEYKIVYSVWYLFYNVLVTWISLGFTSLAYEGNEASWVVASQMSLSIASICIIQSHLLCLESPDTVLYVLTKSCISCLYFRSLCWCPGFTESKMLNLDTSWDWLYIYKCNP